MENFDVGESADNEEEEPKRQQHLEQVVLFTLLFLYIFFWLFSVFGINQKKVDFDILSDKKKKNEEEA